MRLINVTNEHIAQVIQRIDREGIPTNRIHNEYWLLIGRREYPFKLTMTYAMELAGEANTDIEQFRTGPYYLAHIRNMGYTINYYKEDINFFSEFDLRHFAKIAGQPYNHQQINNQLDAIFVRPLVAKLNKWAELAIIEGFEVKSDNTWQWNGNKFKDYFWIKIYRPGASRRVYFIVGVSSDQMNRNEPGYLYVVLECQREKSQKIQVLTNAEIEYFDR